jgi:hypothetical protein
MVRFVAGTRDASSDLGPTQSRIQKVPASLSREVRQPEREVNPPLPSGTGVNDAWSFTFLIQYAFMACTETTVLTSF